MPQPEDQNPDQENPSFSAKLFRIYRPDGSYIEFKNLRIYRNPQPVKPQPRQRGLCRFMTAIIPAWLDPVYRRWLLARVILPLLGSATIIVLFLLLATKE